MKTPPKPNDGKIAKFVKKILTYVPAMSYNKKLHYEKRIYDLHCEMETNRQRLNHLMGDYKNIIRNNHIGNMPISVSAAEKTDTFDNVTIKTLTISTPPIKYMYTAQNKFVDIHEETYYFIQEAAYQLSTEYTYNLRDQIVKTAVEKYNVRVK
jgi:hypothetical protein